MNRKLIAALLALALLLTLCACAPAGNAPQNTATFTDDLGHEVTLSSWAHVAAPQSSFAQLWMLAGGEVYATSTDALGEGIVDFPEDIVDLGSVKTPSVETMISAGVDFALLSADLSAHVELYDTLTAAGIPCAYLDVETFDDYLRALKLLTDLTGRDDLYQQNGEQIKSRIDAAIARKEGHDAPTVLLLRAYSSGVKAKGSDNMAGAMLQDMGCVNIADSDDSLLENLSMEVIIQRDPDYIFVTTMGESDEAALKSVEDTLMSNPAWAELSAVKNGRYVVLPKDLFHLKPNDRWGESYEMLAVILYGEE